MSDELTYVEASCHCELNTFSVAFKLVDLPISTDLCHCTTCRHTTGQLAIEQVSFEGVPLKSAHPGSRSRARSAQNQYSRSRSQSPGGSRPSTPNVGKDGNNHGSSAIVTNGGLLAPPTSTPTLIIDEAPRQPFDLSELVAYKTSPDVIRYFCRACSAHLFFVRHNEQTGNDRWSVSVGALDETEGIVKVGYHIFVGDTLDGGLADHLRSIDGVQLPRFKEDEGTEQVPIDWKADPNPPNNDGDAKQLAAYCHCRAISFAISRPNEESLIPTSAYPDLTVPYNISHLTQIHNAKDEKWWLRPSSDPTHYLAGHCMCTFCRLASGFEIQSWGFVPIYNILDKRTGKPVNLVEGGERPKGLTQYISSPGRYREFCGTCGATVFWWDTARPALLDVSLGLLDEKQAAGARAENWFEWHKDRVSFSEKALSPALAKGLTEGLKASKEN